MSSEKTPLESAVDQAMDAFVYAPIGLLLDGPALFPKLVQQGKNQVQVARMMGQMTVQMGQSELTKRAEATDGPVRDVLSGLGLVTRPKPTPAAEETPTEETPADTPVDKAPVEEPKPKKAKPKKTAAKKTANKKTAGKGTKKPAAKKSAGKATSARKAATAAAGVLGIADYDSLSASQVVSRLRGLVPEELDAVKAYESANRARKTVLNKIIQLQKS